MDVEVSTYWLIRWCLSHLNVDVVLDVLALETPMVVVGLTSPIAISNLTLQHIVSIKSSMCESDNAGNWSTYNVCRNGTIEVRVVILPLVVGVEVLALVIGTAGVGIASAIVGRVEIARPVLIIVPLVVVIAIAVPSVVPVAVGIAIVVVVSTVVLSTSIALVRPGSIGRERCITVGIVVCTVVSSTSIALVGSGPRGCGRVAGEIHLLRVPYTKAMMGVWTTAACFFGEASCKRGHSIELPKAGFQLRRGQADALFLACFFPLAGLVSSQPFWNPFFFFFFCGSFWGGMSIGAFSWDTSPQEAGDSRSPTMKDNSLTLATCDKGGWAI